jgi:hypothetical protein
MYAPLGVTLKIVGDVEPTAELNHRMRTLALTPPVAAIDAVG